MVQVERVREKGENYFYLFMFFVLLILLQYFDYPFVEFFFLIPLLFYLKKVPKPQYILITLSILVVSLFNFMYFHPYGLKFMLFVPLAYLIFFLPFIYLSHKLIRKEMYYLTIPALFFVEVYLLQFTILNNFWINVSAYMSYFPLSIQFLGSYAISAIIIAFNCAIFKIAIREKDPYHYISLIMISVLLFIPIPLADSEEKIGVAGIQGNLDQDWFTRYENAQKNSEKYLSLSEDAIRKYDPKIIVWPEYTFTHAFQFDTIMLERLKNFSEEKDVTLIIGSTRYEDETTQKRYNTLYIIKGSNIKTYDAYEPVSLYDPQILKAEENERITVEGEEIGLLLCYEEQFSYLSAMQTKDYDPEFFISSGNQYYISSERGLYISSLSSNLRAAETNRYIVRTVTSGLSKVIDNTGNTREEIPLREKGILFYEVPLLEEKTFYSNFRMFIETGLFLLSLLLVLLSLFSRRSRS